MLAKKQTHKKHVLIGRFNKALDGMETDYPTLQLSVNQYNNNLVK